MIQNGNKILVSTRAAAQSGRMIPPTICRDLAEEVRQSGAEELNEKPGLYAGGSFCIPGLADPLPGQIAQEPNLSHTPLQMLKPDYPSFIITGPSMFFAAHGYGLVLLAGAEVIKLLNNNRVEINDGATQFYRSGGSQIGFGLAVRRGNPN